MFFKSTYRDSYGRMQKSYLMTRDGFTLLAMGFTGEKAMECTSGFTERNFALSAFRDASRKTKPECLITYEGFSFLVMGFNGKQHKNVLQAIQNLECTSEFNKLNFKPATFRDKKGEQRPEYLITYEGFSFLVMGFTGKDAAMWKERYINAFNEMKQHKHVIDAVENITTENSSVTNMFFESTYKAGTGKDYKEYLMNDEGFMLTAMGFTGKKAINNMECTPEFVRLNFKPYSYTASNGKQNPEYLITYAVFWQRRQSSLQYPSSLYLVQPYFVPAKNI